MPIPETRHSIERALADQRRKRHALGLAAERKSKVESERQLAKLRMALDPGTGSVIRAKFERGVRKLAIKIFRKRPRRGDGRLPAPVEPPRSPRPFQGGAAAPLDFD